jgi:hypothetical protein
MSEITHRATRLTSSGLLIVKPRVLLLLFPDMNVHPAIERNRNPPALVNIDHGNLFLFSIPP